MSPARAAASRIFSGGCQGLHLVRASTRVSVARLISFGLTLNRWRDTNAVFWRCVLRGD